MPVRRMSDKESVATCVDIPISPSVEELSGEDLSSYANEPVSHQSKLKATNWVRKLRLVHNVRPPSCSDSLRQPNSIETAYSLDCS